MCYVNEKTALQSQMLENRLKKRFSHLKKWSQRTGAGVFRLYDRDIPEIPLVLDYYCDEKDAAIAGSLYKRPYEKDEEDEERWLHAMKESVSCALGIRIDNIFIKQRKRQRRSSQYKKFDNLQYTKIVNEKDLSFKVNLSDYLDCGLFPDRRLLRQIVRSEAAGKKVLNLFSYTGSFSVYAAAGRAACTDSVDLSNTYLSWSRENFSLNGFSAQMLSREEDFFSVNKNQGEKQSSINSLIRADVLSFIERASSKVKWDIIIIDPPAFSNSKKMTGNFDLKRDLVQLLGKVINLLNPCGKIFLSVNVRKASIKAVEIEKELSSYSKNLHITDLENRITDEDFKGRKIPKTFEIIP